MDAKKTKDIQRRLSSEYESLIKSINRSRLAAFARLRFIQEALKAMDRGQSGEWVRAENIKRLRMQARREAR